MHLKKLLPLCCTATFSLSMVANCNPATAPLYAGLLPAYESDSGISPQSDNIGWRFKTENGKTYKRLYNYSTKKWIGNWILIP